MPRKVKDSAENGAQGAKKVPGVPFTPLTAKKAQEASVRARNIRKQVRSQMLDTLVNNMDFGQEMLKAYKAGNMDKMALIEQCLRMVGLHYKDSEDAVQNVNLEANTNSNVNATVKFVLGKRPETPEPKE